MLNVLKRDPITDVIINNNEKELRDYQIKIDLIKQIGELKQDIKELRAELEKLKRNERK